MKLRMILSVPILLLIWQNSVAKEWHGIVPLKSTGSKTRCDGSN